MSHLSNLSLSDIIRLFQPAPTVDIKTIQLSEESIVKCSIPLLIITLILFFIFIRKDKTNETVATRRNVFICIFAWLIGISILSITPLTPFFRKVGYVLFIGSIVIYLGLFLYCCFAQDRFGIGNLIRVLILCFILTPIYRAFAIHVSIVIGAIGGAYCFLGTFAGAAGSGGGGGGMTKSDIRAARLENLVEYTEEIDRINEHLADGGSLTGAKVTAHIAAQNFLDTDEKLKQQRDNL